MNVLILSCGTRNKIVQYFKKELGDRGSVIATDCSKLAPALYEADRHYVVPSLDSEDYLEVILDICMENRVKAVLSLIDPELSFLAKHNDLFLRNGVLPIVSDYDAVQLCFDKYRMACFLQAHGYPTARSYISKAEFYADVRAGRISYPVFVKPRKGSASVNINTVYSQEELELLLGKYDDLMIQQFMQGKELGADVYIDMISGEVVSIFAKEKLRMRAGETDKSVSVKDGTLFRLIIDFVKTAGLRGIVDIDIFRVDRNYFISEVNPRFGGGYPHAHECGVNVVEMILTNVQGRCNTSRVGMYSEGVYMMKYSDVKVSSLSEVQSKLFPGI